MTTAAEAVRGGCVQRRRSPIQKLAAALAARFGSADLGPADRRPFPGHAFDELARNLKARGGIADGAALGYRLLGELAARYPGHPDDLTRFELKVFSQNGEDGVIAECLRRLGVSAGHFVEIGASSGVEGNCVFLADVMAWPGVFIEADAARYGALERKYRHNDRVATLHARVSPSNVDGLLGRGGAPPEPDVLSIDVDGNDYWIWQALGAYRPRLVVIEYNGSLDPRGLLVQPLDERGGWDGTEFYGASLGALCSLARAKGYRLVHTELAGVNAFFIRADLAAPFGPPEAVPLRPSSFGLTGGRHRPDPLRRRYLDLSE